MVTTHEATEDIPSMAEKSSRTFAEPAGFPCDFAFGALGFDHFFFEAHKAAECYWHLYECECLTMPAAQILFVLLRNANSRTCFT
jgi:hypothetical protein